MVNILSESQEFSLLAFQLRLNFGIKYWWNEIILIFAEAFSKMHSPDWRPGIAIKLFTSPLN
jgi:hypothetical protein